MKRRARLGWLPEDRRPFGRWCGVLVAVPLAAGGTNSACEADTPPPGAQAEERADERSEERDKERDRGGDGDRKRDGDKGDRHQSDADHDDSRRVVCVVSADVPTFDAESTRSIVGTAKYWCESPEVNQLIVVVRVERQHDDGTWTTVASTRDTAHGRQTLRIEGRHEPVGLVETSCRTGTFRTVVVAKQKADGDVEVVVDNSSQVTDPCQT